MRSDLEKWLQTIRIAWSKHTTYRLNFLLLIIGPTLVFFFIKYSLWTAIFNGDHQLIIKGFNLKSMISYHFWVLIVSLLAQGYTSMNLAEEIRLGRISTYLIYPFNFWEFHTASFLGFQSIQLIVSLVTVSAIIGFGLVLWPGTIMFLQGLLLCFLVGFFWFAMQFLTGIIGFWLEETWILRVILQMVASFLSGAILPLDLYPEWFARFLDWTPFPYLTYYPVQAFMGQPLNFSMAITMLIFWTTVMVALNYFVWKRGIKLYTGAGM